MLSLKSGEPLAKDTKTGKEIFWTENKRVPAILSQCPLDLVDKQILYNIKKKFRLKARFFKNLCAAWSKKSDVFNCPANGVAEQLACETLEKIALEIMKKEYTNPDLQLMPFIDYMDSEKVARHLLICASSSSGKTFLACEVVKANVPEAMQKKVKVYLLSSNPDDPNYKCLQKDYKGTVIIVDCKDFQLEIGLNQIDKGSIVIVDDSETCSKPVQNILAELEKLLIIRGRKWANKGVGTSLISIRHSCFEKHITKYHSNIGQIILFPRVNKHLSTRILKNKFGFSVKEIREILEFVPSGRWSWLFVRTSPAPGYIATKNGVKLL